MAVEVHLLSEVEHRAALDIDANGIGNLIFTMVIWELIFQCCKFIVYRGNEIIRCSILSSTIKTMETLQTMVLDTCESRACKSIWGPRTRLLLFSEGRDDSIAKNYLAFEQNIITSLSIFCGWLYSIKHSGFSIHIGIK